jgi:glucose-6-phosphate isomerase
MTMPFRLDVDLSTGKLAPATTVVERRLSHMQGMYVDPETESRMLKQGNPLIYEVFQYDVPERTGELFVCTTVIQPGKIGDEFFMTKGHYHAVRDRGEVYYGLSGEGQVVMQAEDLCTSVPIGPGIVAYVPPYFAHRTVNTGSEPLTFLAVYPGDAGHDYGSIEESGFLKSVVDEDGTPMLIDRAGLV